MTSALSEQEALVHWRTYREHAGTPGAWCAECSQWAPCDRRLAAQEALTRAGLLLLRRPGGGPA